MRRLYFTTLAIVTTDTYEGSTIVGQGGGGGERGGGGGVRGGCISRHLPSCQLTPVKVQQ